MKIADNVSKMPLTHFRQAQVKLLRKTFWHLKKRKNQDKLSFTGKKLCP